MREFFAIVTSKYGQAGYEDGLHYGEYHQYAEPYVLTNGVLSGTIPKALGALSEYVSGVPETKL